MYNTVLKSYFFVVEYRGRGSEPVIGDLRMRARIEEVVFLVHMLNTTRNRGTYPIRSCNKKMEHALRKS